MEAKQAKVNTESNRVLIDSGFDVPFTKEQIDFLCALFTNQNTIADAIKAIHEQDKVFDLKRGEFYPELLRAILSLKKHASIAYEISPNQVHPNYGSNGSIDTIFAAVKVEESRKRMEGGVLMTSPTYFRNYNSASAKNLKTSLVPLRSDFSIDTDAYIKVMLEKRPSIVLLVTPNNPTGMAIPDEDLYAVLDNLPDTTWALVDRTLANVRPEVSTTKLLQRYQSKNVVVLHSCSKYEGLSHLRIGVALYSNRSMAERVRPHLPLGIGLEGCLKAIQLIMSQGVFRPNKEITANISKNYKILKEFVDNNANFAFSDFSGNYCLLCLPENLMSENVTEILADVGLIVMGGHDFPEPNSGVIRLHTGGSPEHVKTLCDQLSGM